MDSLPLSAGKAASEIDINRCSSDVCILHHAGLAALAQECAEVHWDGEAMLFMRVGTKLGFAGSFHHLQQAESHVGV